MLGDVLRAHGCRSGNPDDSGLAHSKVLYVKQGDVPT